LTRAGQHPKRLQEASPESFPVTDLDNAVAAELTARAQVASAEAALASSELDLANTILKNPISGRIGRTANTRGNLVGPSSEPLARIVQSDPVRVVYSISENDLPAITTALKEAAEGSRLRLLAPQLRLADGGCCPRRGRSPSWIIR